MKRRAFIAAAGTLAATVGLNPVSAAAQAGAALPPPQTPGSKTLEEALRARRSQRAYDSRPLPPEVLSGLLWAAFGVNRPDTGGRTAPSAHNKQEIEIHVAKADGLFLYDAKGHALQQVKPDDLRALTGTQAYAATAPVNLVFVARMDRAAGRTDEEKLCLAWADTGYVSQNVYLYCAAMGLATVVRASIDTAALSKAMGLAPTQRVIMAQCVGYPKA